MTSATTAIIRIHHWSLVMVRIRSCPPASAERWSASWQLCRPPSSAPLPRQERGDRVAVLTREHAGVEDDLPDPAVETPPILIVVRVAEREFERRAVETGNGGVRRRQRSVQAGNDAGSVVHD